MDEHVYAGIYSIEKASGYNMVVLHYSSTGVSRHFDSFNAFIDEAAGARGAQA